MMSKLAGLACVGALMVSIAGCSQVAVLEPVAGDAITSVQIATSDVLTSKDIKVRTWPTCTSVGEDYTCAGTTTTNQPIESKATGDPLLLTVTVDGKQIEQSLVKTVITEAGRKK